MGMEIARASELAALMDEEIVGRVLAGETALFELLMRRYNQRVYRITRAIVTDDAEAEDVTQAVGVRAFEHLDQFGGRARFSTWGSPCTRRRRAVAGAAGRSTSRRPCRLSHPVPRDPNSAPPTASSARRSRWPWTRCLRSSARSSCCARWRASARPKRPPVSTSTPKP